MCLASTPPAGGRKTLLGSETSAVGGLDSAANSFGGPASSDPDFGAPPRRRGTLLAPLPAPDFGELDIAPEPSAPRARATPGFGALTPRELDIAPVPGDLSSTVPAFAPPGAFDAVPATKLPKPASARGSILTSRARGADLSAPSSSVNTPHSPASSPTSDAAPVVPRPAARPAIAATKLDPPPHVAPPVSLPGEDATAGSVAGGASPIAPPSIETAEAEGLDLGGFEETDALGAVGTPSGLNRFLDFTKDFDDTDLAITSEIVGLDPERTALLRDILRAADIADEDDVSDIETAAANLRVRIDALPDTGRNDRARFEQFLDGAVRASGIPGAVRRGSGTMADGILKSVGNGVFDILREDPLKVAATVTGAGLGTRIGRAALAPLIRERTMSPQALAASAARVRAGLSGKQFSNTRRVLNKIDAGNSNSQVRNAVLHLLNGATPSKGRRQPLPNFDKTGGVKEMRADFEALIRNAGGEPGKREPLRKAIGEWIDLPDRTRVLWRLTENKGRRTIEIQIDNGSQGEDYQSELKIRYELDR